MRVIGPESRGGSTYQSIDSVSEAALNLLMVDYARNWRGKVTINAISPSDCKTPLNGSQETKYAKDGAKDVFRIALAREMRKAGFFHLGGTEKFTDTMRESRNLENNPQCS